MYYQNPTQSRQNFYEIKQYCVSNRVLFEDAEFPPVNSSLFVNTNGQKYLSKAGGRIIWKRPFVRNSKFPNFSKYF